MFTSTECNDMASHVARISEFDIDNDDVTEYCERFENFLIANKITEEAMIYCKYWR